MRQIELGIEEEKMKKFNVFIEQESVRDIQVESMNENEESVWIDWNIGNILIDTVECATPAYATYLTSQKYKLPESILFTIEIPQTENNEYFSIVRWHKEDVICTFEKEGIPPTEENLNIFLNSRAAKSLSERLVEEGNEILEILVEEMEDEFNMLLSDKEVIHRLIDIYWENERINDNQVVQSWFDFTKHLHNSNILMIKSLLKCYFEVTEFEIFDDAVDIVSSITPILDLMDTEYFNEKKSEYNYRKNSKKL